jgi:cytochrome b subunit of formate dehydrogenase
VNLNLRRLRQVHRAIAPIFVFPLFLTLLTGIGFQFASLNEASEDWFWLLDLHRGKFGVIDLQVIYPFLNAVGLLTLLVTGILMWLKIPNRRRSSSW